MAPSVPIDVLPNELLIEVLETFPVRSLLPLAAVSRRFHALVSRVHYARLVEAAALHDHELILECYHPSAKISTPYLFCEYLGTDGIAEAGLDPTLGGMNDLYSRFQPVIGEDNRRPRARYPARSVAEGRDAPPAELASHDLFLDNDELFSQLCTVVNLVKVGPRRGMFFSIVNVIDGFIRIWRDWLLREADAKAAAVARDAQRANAGMSDSSILWADSSKNLGLRLRVVETPGARAPVLVGPDDEPPLTCKIEYEELLIRTNQLFLSMETSKAQQVSHTGKAVVIASM